MKIYEKSLSWFALCSTPVIGSAISMAGLCKWANKAAEAQQMLATYAGRMAAAVEGARGASRERQQTVELPEMADLEKTPSSQAFYALTSVTSSVLSLALSVQKLTAPYFALFAVWTLAYGVAAYYADAQVRDVESLGRDDLPKMYSVSFFVNAARYLYNSTLL